MFKGPQGMSFAGNAAAASAGNAAAPAAAATSATTAADVAVARKVVPLIRPLMQALSLEND